MAREVGTKRDTYRSGEGARKDTSLLSAKPMEWKPSWFALGRLGVGCR